MSHKLPVISGKELIKILCDHGAVVRRIRGDHVILQREDQSFAVPLHNELKKGTLLSILKQAKLDPDIFEP